MKNLLVILAVTLITACGVKENEKIIHVEVPSEPVAPADPTVQDQIDEIIKFKNEERAVTALAPLTNGLSCVVQQVASGQCLLSSSTAAGCNSGNVVAMTGPAYTFLYKGEFNQPEVTGADVDVNLPASIRALFIGKNYRISCTGFIVVLKSNYYDFTLNSDDGSILSVAGAQVINHDNNHGMSVKTGSALLYRGVQSFSLLYAQTGGGNHGLVLQSAASAINPIYYFH